MLDRMNRTWCVFCGFLSIKSNHSIRNLVVINEASLFVYIGSLNWIHGYL